MFARSALTGEGTSNLPDNETRKARRDRQSSEIEQNQQALRTSIAVSKRLADEADAMIKRHRVESDETD